MVVRYRNKSHGDPNLFWSKNQAYSNAAVYFKNPIRKILRSKNGKIDMSSKYRTLMKVSFLVLSLISPTIVMAEETKSETHFSTGQKWVLGLTGVALLATARAEKHRYAQEGRQSIVAVGLVSFIGVTIFKGKNKKVSMGLNEGSPALSYNFTF